MAGSELNPRGLNVELLIAVLRFAQATEVSAYKATAKLYPVANTPETILALGEPTLRDHLKTIDLQGISMNSRRCIQHHNGPQLTLTIRCKKPRLIAGFFDAFTNTLPFQVRLHNQTRTQGIHPFPAHAFNG